jgi:uncharacterized protein (DUF433 family)
MSYMYPGGELIVRSPEILGGTPVFAGTRAGDSLDLFLEDFPTVTREQLAKALLLAEAK